MSKINAASGRRASRYPMLRDAIRRLEAEGKMSHQALANALGLGVNTVAQWAQGNALPNWETAASLIRYTGRRGWRILVAMGLQPDEINRLVAGWIERGPEVAPKLKPPADPRIIVAKHPNDRPAAIREMRDAGLTYREIAEAIGRTRQRAHQLDSTPKPNRNHRP